MRTLRFAWSSFVFLVLACTAVAAEPHAVRILPPPWLPADPGAAHCAIDRDGAELTNAALRFAVTTSDGVLRPAAFDNRFTAAAHELHGELFTLGLPDKKSLAASAFKLQGQLTCAPVKPNFKAARAADRARGVALEGNLVDADSGLRVHWRALLRDGANYLREEVVFTAARDVQIPRVALIDLDLANAFVAGTVQGSPVVADDRFFGVEHPMAQARLEAGHAAQFVKRVLPLHANVAASYSAVFGVATPGQLRRAFAAYLERERAHPFRTFLHYNSWYDIGYFTPYTEADALGAINAYVRKLAKERGVVLDSFLFDDGWDDYEHLWQFNSGFPRGFAPLAKAAEAAGAEPGMWLSPWGGYGSPRERRLNAAKVAGYEVDEQGLALSGPKYYELFHKTTLDLLTRYHINQFKLDGTGSPDKVTPGSAFDSDFAAAIALIEDLRHVKPELFVNLTTGTWPSPFWLRTADSIWRGGEDHEFLGRGSDRQRWITYRDADTYGGIVRQGPLFPLNSLMLHGIIYAKHAHGLNVNPDSQDFRDEVRSYFASGTGLQEMYVSPDLLNDADWDVLATSAKWARSRAEVLRDSHWIGGDPARDEVYGWAAWSPARAVIALRNPSTAAQDFTLDTAAALELPRGAASSFRAASPYENDTRRFDATKPAVIHLEPFQVRVWDLVPDTK